MINQEQNLFRLYFKSNGFFSTTIFDTGRHPEETILKCFKAIASKRLRNKECVAQISGSLSNGYVAHCETDETDNYFYETDVNNSASLTFSFYNKTKCKCNRKQCFENISNGKCTNEFVRETIGKNLFSNQYSQQR